MNMHVKKGSGSAATVVALVFSVLALASSAYSAVTLWSARDGLKSMGSEEGWNAMVEKGIDAYVKKQQAANQQPPAPTGPVDVSLDDDAVEGSADAKVTMVEFSDFQCPFCERFYTQSLAQIRTKYIDTGKVKLVFRDFPLPFHDNARPAAIAAECVRKLKGSDKAYFEFHDKIFSNQAKLSDTSLKQWAADMGIEGGAFEACQKDEAIGAEVDKDEKEGQSYGVQGTPAFFINGRFISGAQPYANFEKVIEEELAK